ncbi:M14 family metallopeptidase [Rhodovibrionaceae bacterium A322]
MTDLLTAADSCFSVDYREARARFLAACEAAGLEVTSHLNPNTGPHGEELATDVAWDGPADARKVLVMLSATHGVEGFPGSAAQLDWLTNLRQQPQPEDFAVLLVHAVNPHGFAWQRRVSEEGIDMNRNYVDFSQPLPENPGYDELHSALVPDSLDPAHLADCETRLKAFQEKHGAYAFSIARSGGQYTEPGGVFFGGKAPAWARRTLESIITEHRLADRELVAVVDYHTGLGPYGYGEPICDHPVDSINVARAKSWYGDSVTQPSLGTSSSPPKHGLNERGWERMLGDKVTFIALEYGTYQPPRGMEVLRADHWLHNRGPVDWNSPETQKIKKAIREHFVPPHQNWRESVLFRSRQILRQAKTGLTGS